MARPLYLESASSLREISNANIERIAYWVRTRYAAQLNSGGSGAIYVGGSGTTIGSMSDTSNTASVNSRSRNYTPGTDYPAYPTTFGATETDTTYTYRQNRNTVTAPSNAVADANSGLLWDGATGLEMGKTLSHFETEIFDAVLSEMRTGDQVGTYRVSTSSPGTGWTDKGVWFTDSTYSAGTVTYRLYLKTSDSTIPGTAPTAQMVIPDGSSGVRGNGPSITETGGFVVSVLLPLFTNWVRANSTLNYTVNTSVSGINRGSFSDTRQDGLAQDRYFTNPTYYSRTAPGGGRVTKSTEFLSLN